MAEVEGKPEHVTVDLKDQKGWPNVFWALQFPAVRKLVADVERRGGATFKVELEPETDPTWPLWMRGLEFAADVRTRQEESLWTAGRAGFEKTWVQVIRLYLFLRGLVITHTVSPKLLAGPISIGKLAYHLADQPSQLILFLGILSVHLAVINYLPIPILDGGHMVFLAYELVTRRQPSERALKVAYLISATFLLCLMVYVLRLDIMRLFGLDI
jgi:regulator of sigma E protease